MSYKFTLHPGTQKDFTEAFEWYEDKTEGLGERFLQAARKKIEEKLQRNQELMVAKEEKVIVKRKFTSSLMSLFLSFNRKERLIFISSIHHIKKHPNKKYRK